MTRPLVMFDFDGVLVASAPFLMSALFEQLRELGYRFLRAPADAAALFEENIADALIGRGVTPDHLCAVWEHVQQAERTADIRLSPGIPEMLEMLAPLCTMAVVSSNSAETVRAVLRRLGALERFASVSGGDEEMVKVRRIADCARALEIPPEQSIYVGDSAGDVGEAREAGVIAVAAAWGLHSAERLAKTGATRVVRTPAEIVEFVRARQGEGSA